MKIQKSGTIFHPTECQLQTYSPSSVLKNPEMESLASVPYAKTHKNIQVSTPGDHMTLVGIKAGIQQTKLTNLSNKI